MPVLSGNTSGSIAGIPYNIPSVLKRYRLFNTSGSDITVNVSIVSNETGDKVLIAPKDFIIKAGTGVTENIPVFIEAMFTVYLVTSGALDYYFEIE